MLLDVRVGSKFRYERLYVPMSILMIIAGSLFLYFESWEHVRMRDLLSWTLFIALGIVSLVHPKRSNMRTIGCFGIALGVSTAIDSLGSLMQPSWGSETLAFALFILRLIWFCLGVSLAYRGISFIRGKALGIIGQITKSYFLMMLQFGILFIRLAFFPPKPEDFFTSTYINVMMFVLYFAYIFLLTNEDVTDKNKQVGIMRRMRLSRDVASIDNNTFIHDEDIDFLRNMDSSPRWKEIDDGSPVEKEAVIAIHSTYFKYHMILQKWKGSDKTYVTIVNNCIGSFIRCPRFSITEVGEDAADDDGRYVMIYGSDRIQLKLRLGGETEWKRIKSSSTL